MTRNRGGRPLDLGETRLAARSRHSAASGPPHCFSRTCVKGGWSGAFASREKYRHAQRQVEEERARGAAVGAPERPPAQEHRRKSEHMHFAIPNRRAVHRLMHG